jgi:hypothetical protein
MSTIYVVTQGIYSCYGIVGATTDYEVAKKIADKFSEGWDECRIEKYEDGEYMLRPAWVVYFDKNGNVKECHPAKNDYEYHKVHQRPERNLRYDFIFGVSADTEEAAIKIAAEKRAQYLAEEMGL